MCNRIRRYMGYVDGDFPIGGPTGRMVEVDKTYIGGHDKIGEDDKTIVLGMVERGGDVVTRIVADRRETTVVPEVLRWVKPGSRITTDTGRTFYNLYREDFEHFKVNHAGKQWVDGDAHTNSIEGFWANIKRGINGTYISVSEKWLQTYLWEFEFRHNLRNSPELMFDLLLHAFPGPVLKPLLKEAG